MLALISKKRQSRLLDGRLVSDFLLTRVSHEVKKLRKKKIFPKLVIILVGKNPASLSYIRQKEKATQRTDIQYEQLNLRETITTKKLISIIEKLNRDKTVHGILVQLPLPAHIETPLVLRAIDPAKDVDGFGAYNLGKMFLSTEFENLAPCTPRGIIRLLEYYKISPAGKRVTIIGRSNIVGKPLAAMLINRDATVTVCHSKTKNLALHTRDADILVAAVGRPKMVKAAMVKMGAVVIDVGTTKVNNRPSRLPTGQAGSEAKQIVHLNSLVGDVDFENVKRKASWITPVPGGVGPMTVACLMENVMRAAVRLNE